MLRFDQERKASIGGTDSTAVPIAEEVPTDKGLQLLHSHLFRIAAVVGRPSFHSGPRAFAASVAVTASARVVHLLEDTEAGSGLAVEFAGVLHPR